MNDDELKTELPIGFTGEWKRLDEMDKDDADCCWRAILAVGSTAKHPDVPEDADLAKIVASEFWPEPVVRAFIEEMDLVRRAFDEGILDVPDNLPKEPQLLA